MPLEDSTRQIDVETIGARGSDDSPLEGTDAWSFGPMRRVFFQPFPENEPDPAKQKSLAANVDEPVTFSPHALDVIDMKPVTPPRANFGKRGFALLYQWEGVVEEAKGDTFRARLLPLGDGRPDASRVEYGEFSYDDLADEGDYDLVAEGAVFYWTVGRSRNSSGTYTNTSLVRFRRLPPASSYHVREAILQAEAMLVDLGGDNRGNPASS